MTVFAWDGSGSRIRKFSKFEFHVPATSKVPRALGPLTEQQQGVPVKLNEDREQTGGIDISRYTIFVSMGMQKPVF